MKKEKQGNREANAEPVVYCSECKYFVRDTEGISRRKDTGEYFMGICVKALKPDTSKKQFADKPRRCRDYSSILTQKN